MSVELGELTCAITTFSSPAGCTTSGCERAEGYHTNSVYYLISAVLPENSFLIEEYLDKAAALVNSKKNIFEKALLAVLFISYIQPFEDGNKRTARLTANAILMGHNCCPLSYRSISPADYKKAILLFYEINNLSAFKKLFMEQYEFAVNTYF